MSSESGPTPASEVASTAPQSDRAGSEQQPGRSIEEYLTEPISRRAAFRRILLGAAGAGVVGAGAGAAIAEVASPGFLAKLARAITSGKLFGDVQEVAVSRLKLNNEQFNIARFETIPDDQRELWMDAVSTSMWVVDTTAKEEKSGATHSFVLADITSTTNVYELSSATQAALADLVLSEQCMTLPGPQYVIPADQRDGRRYDYLFTAETAVGDQLSQAQIPDVAKRGGLVLDSTGVLSVVTPNKMESVYASVRSNSATNAPQMIMEYAFVIDSQEVGESLATVENASSGALGLKDLAYSVEYMNFVVTMYDENEIPQTFIFATYEPQKTSQQTTAPHTVRPLNLYQVTTIIEELRQRLDKKRFVIAVPDPSEVSASLVPQLLDSNQQGSTSADATRHLRSLGTDTSYTEVNPTQKTFRWVLASHRDAE